MGLCRKLVKLGVAATGCAYLINTGIDYLASIRHLLKKDKGLYYPWDNHDIFYTKEGNGSPLLLLHDLKADHCSYEWHRVVGKLAEEHTVYTVDLPGCGRSDKPGINYTAYYYFLFLKSFIQEIIKEPVSVICVGNSCCFSLLAAAEEDCQITNLTLIDPLSYEEITHMPNKKDQLFWKLISVPIFGTFAYNMVYNFTRVEEQLADKFYNKANCTKEYVDTFYEAAHSSKSAGKFLYASKRGGYLNLPIERPLKTLQIPVRILIGEKNSCYENICEYYTSLNSDIEITTIPETKNLPHLERPLSFVNIYNRK